jgi:hypothetical protein
VLTMKNKIIVFCVFLFFMFILTNLYSQEIENDKEIDSEKVIIKIEENTCLKNIKNVITNNIYKNKITSFKNTIFKNKRKTFFLK